MSKANEQVIEQDWWLQSTSILTSGRRVTRRTLRGQVTRGQVMGYRVTMGPIEYVGTRDGQPFSLTAALAAVDGCGQAHVLRPDGTVVR